MAIKEPSSYTCIKKLYKKYPIEQVSKSWCQVSAKFSFRKQKVNPNVALDYSS